MNRLLIVDDEEINREVLKNGLKDLFDITEAKDGQEALDFLYYEEHYNAVLLDLKMPGLTGFDVLKDMNDTGLIEKIPVYVITSTENEKVLLQAYELGASDVISKSYNLNFLRRKLLNTVELYSQKDRLSDVMEEKTKEMQKQNNRLVEAMADLVEFRSNESGTHVKRVSGYTRILMEGLISEYPEYKSLYNDVDSICFAATLHDIGKIAVPDNIINKPGKYTTEEFEIMKNHTIHGYEQILTMKDVLNPMVYYYSIDIARHHHERFDGRGYPDKLRGDQISIWSQAVAVADVYDALTCERCYKQAYDHATACNMILSGECGIFNPKVINVFENLNPKFDEFRLGITRKKILIVDDSEIDRSTLRTILQKDYDVCEIESGILALAHLRSHVNEYDALIIDVYMPNLDGFDLIRKIGREFTEKTPVLMSSAEVSKERVKQAVEYGVKAFLKKPFEYESLLKKIESIIGK